MTFWGWSFEEAFYFALVGFVTVVLWLRVGELPPADESASAARNRLACWISGAALLAMLFAVRIAVHEYHPSFCGTGIRFAKEMMRYAILFGSPATAVAWRLADPSGGTWTWTLVHWSASVFAGCCGFWIVMLCL